MTTLNNRLQLALLNRRNSKNVLEKGFTLVELMIVIVIVGILSAVALPNFLSQTKQSEKLTEATSKINACLKKAHSEYQISSSDTNAVSELLLLEPMTQNGYGIFDYFYDQRYSRHNFGTSHGSRHCRATARAANVGGVAAVVHRQLEKQALAH